MVEIHMGIPEMEDFWNALTEKVSLGTASVSKLPPHIMLLTKHRS